MKTLLVVSDDKICGRALESLKDCNDQVHIVIDRSTRIDRVARLVLKGRLSVGMVLKMALCEFLRPGHLSPRQLDEIRSNIDLVQLINTLQPERVVLFRAGLIINRQVIGTRLPIMNIHCANVPEYAGLGSIHRALVNKAYEQSACLHIVTTTIDGGEVLDREPFIMKATDSYCVNEDIAYDAGIRLLRRTIEKI